MARLYRDRDSVGGTSQGWQDSGNRSGWTDEEPGGSNFLDDTFSADTVNPYRVNRDNFYAGGSWQASQGNLSDLDRFRRNQAGDAARAQNRAGVQIDGRQSAGAYRDTQAAMAREEQARALGMESRGLALQSRADQMRNIGAMRDQANARMGPSLAQAQLTQGQDANMAQALALARSGRGGAQAMRSAMDANNRAGQATNMQAAALRAQEVDAFQQRRAQGLGAVAQGLEGARAGDAQLRAGDAQIRGMDQGMIGLGQSQQQIFNQSAQAQADFEARQRQLNDQMTLGKDQLGLSYEQMRQQQMMAELQAAGNYEQQQGQHYMGAQTANQQADLANDESNKGIAAAGAAAIGGMLGMSDRRAKTDIKDTDVTDTFRALGGDYYAQGEAGFKFGKKLRSAIDGDQQARNFPRSPPGVPGGTPAQESVRPLKAQQFRYKPGVPGAPPPGQKNVGIMAQDLERTPAGATVVQQDQNGLKRIDVGKAAMLNLAATGDQQRQLDEHERLLRAQALGYGGYGGRAA